MHNVYGENCRLSTAAVRGERALDLLLGGIDFERFEKRRDLLRKPQAGLD